MAKSNDEFLLEAGKEIDKAWGIVLVHEGDGENDIIPMSKMFPHGAQDLVYEIYKKVCRMLGYEKHGNLTKVYDEAQDVLNYCAFLLTILQEKK